MISARASVILATTLVGACSSDGRSAADAPTPAPAKSPAVDQASLQEWPGKDRWHSLRTEIRAQLMKEISDRVGEEAAARAGLQVDNPVRIPIPLELHTDTTVRFFKVGFGWNTERSITCGSLVVGARRGSQELARIGGPVNLGGFLSLSDLEIASPAVLGVLVDRVCYGWDDSTGDPKSSAYREAEGYVVENKAGRWVFRTDKDGHVVGVRKAR